MIPVQRLKEMNREQLLDFAAKIDLKIHHKSKDDTIRRVIAEELGSRQMQTKPETKRDGWEEPKPVAAAPVFNNTPEEVLEAIGALKDKEGFKIDFPGDNTVIFTYRGISESCNLSIPMHIIKRQAKIAAQTKYAPAMIKDGEVRNKDGSSIGVMMFG